MTDVDRHVALDLAVDIATWAAETITSSGGHQPARQKDNPADLVTDTDIYIERTVRARIARAYPDHAVHGEELGTPDRENRYTWYVDPIDGTTNYASGLPWCSFSLALADDGEPLVGVVVDPYRKEQFTAVRGGGAFLDGRPIACPDATSLAGGVVLTEWNGHRPWAGMDEALGRLSDDFATVRIMGSSALALASAAVGRARGALIGAFHPVDDMAAVLIAREAGAVVRGRGGTTDPGPDGVMVAAPGVADRLSRLWG